MKQEGVLFFDIETDGLLDTLTKVHCLGFASSTSKATVDFSHHAIENMCEYMSDTTDNTLVGHNVIAFDIPALTKVFGFRFSNARVIDTLVLSRLIFPDLAPEDDKLIRSGKMPSSLLGSHSLEAWGYRLGCFKGDFKGPWEESEVVAGSESEEESERRLAEWRAEMRKYCAQDVELTRKLYEHLMAQKAAQEAIELEHKVQTIVQRQVRHGVGFDVDAAIALNAELNDKLAAITKVLKDTFRGFFKYSVGKDGKATVKTPASNSSKYGYTAGASFCPVTWTEFNPGSRQHIVRALLEMGWKPAKFTESGQPKVDDEILAGLTYRHVDKLRDYLLITKRLSQLESWLDNCKRGRIHGSVNTNGAVTGRMTHANPNLAQVPAVQCDDSGVLLGYAGGWGYEMRQLFTAGPGRVLVGCDASGLELRMLAHYMGRYDGGEYADTVVNGDIHSKNQEAAGLPTRKNAKTFISRKLRDDLVATPRLKLCELSGPLGRANTEPSHDEILKRMRIGLNSSPTFKKSHAASLGCPTFHVGRNRVLEGATTIPTGSTAKQLEAHSPQSCRAAI